MISGFQSQVPAAPASGEVAAPSRAAQFTARPHICFLAPRVYPVLANLDHVELVGGAEVQQAVLARILRVDGYRVSVLSADYGQPERVDCSGIEVYRLPEVGQRGVKGLRFIYPRMTDIVKHLKTIDPDIVYMRAAGGLAAAAAWYARWHGKKFVYACASDMELRRDAEWPAVRRDAVAFRAGLRRADGILVQNAAQLKLLQDNYGREGQILPNVYTEPGASRAAADGHVLWVGTIKPLKRPEMFIELARRFPGRRFKMVGGPEPDVGSATAYYEGVRQAAQQVPNLDFVGFVPFAQVGRFFDGASVLLNTSTTEGFPNTFLQAWMRGVPSLSFVSPEVRPDSSGTNACADLADMSERLGQLTSDPSAWRLASRACESHFERTHSVAALLRSYREYFGRLCAPRAGR
jgi:glycosyltransferase involved in cell wall biosynthesis